jgi:hypothetical protein
VLLKARAFKSTRFMEATKTTNFRMAEMKKAEAILIKK